MIKSTSGKKGIQIRFVTQNKVSGEGCKRRKLLFSRNTRSRMKKEIEKILDFLPLPYLTRKFCHVFLVYLSRI